MGRANTCNVLSAEPTRREVWRFTRNGNRCVPAGQKALGITEPLPANWVAKGWSHLWNPKLNVAWLPDDKVFLRVLHLPPCEESEVLSMVEFQLEKLSPLPLTQIVWTIEHVKTAQAAPGTPRTVLVLIASRDVVEEHLGRLEAGGYQADRLELPTIHELIERPVAENSAWIYPRKEGDNASCVIAWWFGGVLQQVSLFRLTTEGNWERELQDQVAKVSWAGEMEGWFAPPFRWHLVADDATASAWLPVVQKVAEGQVDVVRPKPLPELATASAVHALRNGLNPGLMPADHVTKYRQQFAERLWMRGLGVIALLYVLAVGIYLGALQYRTYQRNSLTRQIEETETDYNKAIQLSEKIKVVEMQTSLRFAALDAWKAIVANLPDGLTLKRLSFDRGYRLTVSGEASPSDGQKVTDFTETLGRLQVNGRRVFKEVPVANTRRSATVVTWSFSCEFAGGEQ
ncbi:MAG: hypothetical protein K0Q55_3475 [Verrucomicrobia bacterium]|jgi:hypothetical protein|nr:hypothetical protein [Verrucomicrobiota bacterium]